MNGSNLKVVTKYRQFAIENKNCQYLCTAQTKTYLNFLFEETYTSTASVSNILLYCCSMTHEGRVPTSHLASGDQRPPL